jgi:hypothetical protein
MEPEGWDRKSRLGTFAVGKCLAAEFLRLTQSARRQGDQRLRRANLPELRRLTKLLRDCGVAGHLGLCPGEVAQLNEQEEPMEVRGCETLSIAGSVRNLIQLVRKLEALGDRVRGNDGGGAAVEGVRESDGISRPAGELDRVTAQPVSPLSRRFVAQRAREARQQTHSKRDLLLTKCG